MIIYVLRLTIGGVQAPLRPFTTREAAIEYVAEKAAEMNHFNDFSARIDAMLLDGILADGKKEK